jgi:hypothetical protein
MTAIKRNSDRNCLTTNELHAFCGIKMTLQKKFTYPTHLLFKLMNHLSFKTVQKTFVAKNKSLKPNMVLNNPWTKYFEKKTALSSFNV